MMVILRWILALPVIVICVFLAVSNRDDITIAYSPLHDPISLPLYFFALCILALGFLAGSLLTWLSTGNVRKERRRYKKELKLAQKELDVMRESTLKDSPVLLENNTRNNED